MANDDGAESIRFYFSFRSPYAWLAAERLDDELGDLGVSIEPIPIFPTPELFPNDPSALPEKVAYLVQDVSRLARAQGLSVRFPSATEADWVLAHAAVLGALRDGLGNDLMIRIFRKRFAEGLDVGEEAVLTDAAREAGLEPDRVLAYGHDESLRAETSDAWRAGKERDGIFGVPSFVYRGRLYWGQDRIHFLRSAVIRKSGSTRVAAD